MHFMLILAFKELMRECSLGKVFVKKESVNTGRFIMYSGITKIYYRKTVGQVFTKPVQIEGTTQNFFPPPSKLFFLS
jgi:hypothetical protein